MSTRKRTSKKTSRSQPTCLKLGTVVKDVATQLSGTLVHMQIEMNGVIFYNFQPHGLNPEDGMPVKKLWLVPNRIDDAVLIPEPDLPLYVLGTFATDEATGFCGTIVSLIVHISGCVHALIQPHGSHPKTGGPVDACDFDITRLKGIAVPSLTEKARQAQEKEHPSPASGSVFTPHSPR